MENDDYDEWNLKMNNCIRAAMKRILENSEIIESGMEDFFLLELFPGDLFPITVKEWEYFTKYGSHLYFRIKSNNPNFGK